MMEHSIIVVGWQVLRSGDVTLVVSVSYVLSRGPTVERPEPADDSTVSRPLHTNETTQQLQ